VLPGLLNEFAGVRLLLGGFIQIEGLFYKIIGKVSMEG
jgi:hypothetical protein